MQAGNRSDSESSPVGFKQWRGQLPPKPTNGALKKKIPRLTVSQYLLLWKCLDLETVTRSPSSSFFLPSQANSFREGAVVWSFYSVHSSLGIPDTEHELQDVEWHIIFPRSSIFTWPMIFDSFVGLDEANGIDKGLAIHRAITLDMYPSSINLVEFDLHSVGSHWSVHPQLIHPRSIAEAVQNSVTFILE